MHNMEWRTLYFRNLKSAILSIKVNERNEFDTEKLLLNMLF